MSAHYSKFDLNTYRGTAYFRTHVPADYPLDEVLQACRAFRRLPTNLRELSALSRQWAEKHLPNTDNHWGNINQWYDEEGYELDPYTGKRLTDAQIDSEWASNGTSSTLTVQDIPIPPGGFADPDTWRELLNSQIDNEDPGYSREQLLRDIESHGREYVARDAGITLLQLKSINTDSELADMILGPATA